MFQFSGFPSHSYVFTIRYLDITLSEFPHSEIFGSKFTCNSPKLIAAYHVLHRLLMPRHSPCALISLTSYFLLKKKVGKENFNPSFLFQESVSLIWFSLSSNYAGFRFNKIIVLPFSLSKSSTISFVSLCCLLFILWLLCSVFKVRF